MTDDNAGISKDMTTVLTARSPILKALVAVFVMILAACANGSVATPTPTVTPSPPTVTPSPASLDCAAFRSLAVDAGGESIALTVSSCRCGLLHVDSTAQSPEAGVVRATTGDEIGFDFGAALIPALIEVRLYEGDRVAASFMRWPEELPTGIKAIESGTLPPSRTPVLVLNVSPGNYSLVVHALWDLEGETFFATGVDID